MLKTVYHADNSVEAHMVSDMLRQTGIESHINGEHLQGAVGELQALGLVRVMVDEQDINAAREVIDQWESQEEETIQASKNLLNSSERTTTFAAGVLVGIVVTLVFVGLLAN